MNMGTVSYEKCHKKIVYFDIDELKNMTQYNIIKSPEWDNEENV